MPKAATLPKKVYSIAEAFATLDVSRPVGYAMLKDGRLESYMIGTRRYVSEAQLDHCIARLEAAGATAPKPGESRGEGTSERRTPRPPARPPGA